MQQDSDVKHIAKMDKQLLGLHSQMFLTKLQMSPDLSPTETSHSLKSRLTVKSPWKQFWFKASLQFPKMGKYV